MLEMPFGLWKHKYVSCGDGEKIRIAIMYQVASYWPTIESFYEACTEDAGVDVRIFYVRETSVETVQVVGSDGFLLERGIPFEVYSEYALRNFNPHAALYQPPYDVAYRNPDALSWHLREMGIRIVYIPYGIEIADTQDARWNHFHTLVVRNAWRIYTFSDAMREDYIKYCPNRHAVRAVGIPKFDSLSHRERITAPALKRAAAGRKIILWKMHFPKLIYEGIHQRQVTPELDEYIRFAEETEQYREFCFVVMPHPMFFSHTIDRKLSEKAKQLFGLLKDRENVLVDHADDYRISLYHADAVIIDRSAVMIEAGFLDVPVLYMKNADYEEPLTGAVKILTDSYEQGTGCDDIKNFLERFREQKLTAVTERIRKARHKFLPHGTGECGKRILADMKEGISGSESNVIRIIFFGAGYICAHYMDQLDIKNNKAFEIVCLSDNSSSKWGTRWCGIEVVPPNELKYTEADLIVVASDQYFMPIKKGLVYDLYLQEEKIIRLDVFSELYRKMKKEDNV